MPFGTSGWTVDPFVTWRDRVRGDVNGRLGFELDYDATPEGALADATADALWTLDQGGQSVVDGLSPVTAADEQLDAIGERVRIRRNPATRTRYTVTADLADGASAVVIPAGAVLSYTGPGGETRWSVVEAVTVDDGDPLVIEADEAGARFLPSSTVEIRVVTPVSGLESVTRNPADPVQLGRNRESPASYRQRLQRLSSSDGGTLAGWLRAIERVGFVRAASISITAPASALIRVVPGSLTDTQRDTLAQAIVDAMPPILFDGAGDGDKVEASGVDPFGSAVPVVWYEGTEQTVDASAEVALESGYTLGDGGPLDVEPAMIDAYEALFATLSPGTTIRWTDYYCALADVDGVSRVVTTPADTWLSSSGEQVDVSPSSATDLLVAGDLTASVAT